MIASLEAILLSAYVMISQSLAEEKRQVQADHRQSSRRSSSTRSRYTSPPRNEHWPVDGLANQAGYEVD
jgi:hypothetical protein